MPRKMTDTTPLRGIPTPRMPTTSFRSPTSTQGPSSRPNMPRQQPGRKDGGIKILDITEQPLGYAAAKKRKRQQELEEQQKRALEAQSSPPVKSEPDTPVTTPDYAVGLNATSVYTQPATPAPNIVKEVPSNTTNDFVKTETGEKCVIIYMNWNASNGVVCLFVIWSICSTCRKFHINHYTKPSASC